MPSRYNTYNPDLKITPAPKAPAPKTGTAPVPEVKKIQTYPKSDGLC